MYKLRKIVWQNDVMNGANITCFTQQTAWMVVDMVAVVLPSSVAGEDNYLLWMEQIWLVLCDRLPEWWLVWSLLCFPLRLLAGRSGFRLNDGSNLKLLIKLVGARRFVFGRARQGWLVEFVCSNVLVLVLLSGSHLWFISVLILDSYVSHDDTMIS